MDDGERDELCRLRRENALLRVEKEMLLRIATEYALERCGGLDEQLAQEWHFGRMDGSEDRSPQA